MFAVTLTWFAWFVYLGPNAVRAYAEEQAYRKDVRKMEAFIKGLERGE